MQKFTYVIKRSGAIVPFNKNRIMNAIYRAAVAVGGRDKNKAEWLAGQVVKKLEEIYPEGYKPHIEEIQDVVEKILIKNGHDKVAKEYILYRNERNRKRKEKSKKASQPSENIPWSKLWKILNWAVEHNLNTIESLNKRIANGEFPHIVHESESAYEDEVVTACDLITEKSKDIQMVIISGPSSSGKTTTTIKIKNKLKKIGMKFVPLNVDNYFYDLELHPKDEFGDYDFETPQALDLKLVNAHILKLLNGEEILIPLYDFKTGTRKPNQIKMKLNKNEVLLIDSLHGLYPEFAKEIPDENKFKLYLEPLLQMKDNDNKYIRWSDIRLMRRMLRDSAYRAYNPQQTLAHWHYVRSSEMQNIIPQINTTDFIINSAMPYELPIYANRLTDSFIQWEKQFKDEPLREDAYKRASRIARILQSVEPVEDESAIPGDSVIREFIGGSKLGY